MSSLANRMAVVICPGFHALTWTTQFLRQLDEYFPDGKAARFVFPAHQSAPWSAYELRTFLEKAAIAPATPLVFVGFSAGCVAATGAIWYLTQQGRPVVANIALDGWGVPVAGPCRSYRLSHDVFTHQTSAWLGAGNSSFYADPPVSHQQLWCNPAQVWGWQVESPSVFRKSQRIRITALQFLVVALKQHSQMLDGRSDASPAWP